MKNRPPRSVVSVVVASVATCFLTASALAGQVYPLSATSHPSDTRLAVGDYSFVTLDPPFGEPGVDLAVQILWINNNGIVTAQYQSPLAPDPLDNIHTAVLRQGVWHIIDVTDALSTGGTNANNNGQVVLSYTFADAVWHTAIYDQHGLRLFPDIPGYPGGSLVQGLNDRRQVAAVVIDADGLFHGLIRERDHYRIFDYPDPDVATTVPYMLNNSGLIVGEYALSDGTPHAFSLEDGNFANVDRPGGDGSFALSVNNRRAILGAYLDADGEFVGYLLDEEGEYTDFVVPGATQTIPASINDSGEIAGIYADNEGIFHGFVATANEK